MLYRSIVTMALLLTGSLAIGQTTFQAQDENGDGKISKDEYYGLASDMGIYADHDANDDGLIETNEFDEIGWDYDYDAWDLNEDSYLDSGEFYDGYFGEFDEDENGHWDNGEWDDAGDGGLFDI